MIGPVTCRVPFEDCTRPGLQYDALLPLGFANAPAGGCHDPCLVDRVAHGGKRYSMQGPFRFHKAGKAGIAMCEHFQHSAGVADVLCVYRGCVAGSMRS